MTIFIVVANNSYAYFEEDVEGSCVSLEVGKFAHTLNGKVTLSAGKTEKIDLVVKNTDDKASKYQMYYTSEDDMTNVSVGYSNRTIDLPSGDIEASGEKQVTVVIKNDSTSKKTIYIGVRGGLSTNTVDDIILEDGESRINTEIKLIYEDESGANVPELTSGMIPVYYDGTNWVKADIYEEWYDYEKQNWANAVTVTKETRDNYMTMDAGEPISMDDINTMWVWIPRYEYQYTNLGTSYAGGTAELPGEIKIRFISDEVKIPNDSSKYKIPEGFRFGSENIPGFWMAKFETSTLESCTAATGCDLTTLTPQVKPNITSWRGASVSTYFETSRAMQSSTNAIKYGFTTQTEGTMDVHMLKNTEWGIVAMLSQSRYGKYGNPNYEGANKEVYQNKSSSFITGMSNGTPPTDITNTQVTYDTENTGYGASTTGTIYGVYDMSGGAAEYVMGNYNNYSGHSTTYNSGFSGTNGPTTGGRAWPNSKYFDLYTTDTTSTGYKFGDATYETSGWYSDEAFFVGSYYPWFLRGGDYGFNTDAGVFHMRSAYGDAYIYYASRLAIKP